MRSRYHAPACVWTSTSLGVSVSSTSCMSATRRSYPVRLDDELTHGPPHVALDQVDHLGDGRGESLDAQLMVHKDGAHARARQQVVHVVVGPRQIGHLGLQFGVDRGQFLVDRLQFFLGGLQFLVGGLQLLVHGLHFLVGGLELFVRGLQFLVGGLEVSPPWRAIRASTPRCARRRLPAFAPACSPAPVATISGCSWSAAGASSTMTRNRLALDR